MNIENLTRMVAAEAAIQTLTRVPEHYVEISKIILNKASDDIADADQVNLWLSCQFKFVV